MSCIVYERMGAAQADALQKLGIEAFPFDIDGDYLPLKGPARETLLRRCAERLHACSRLRTATPTCLHGPVGPALRRMTAHTVCVCVCACSRASLSLSTLRRMTAQTYRRE
jgi:hypothetical protein